MIVAVQLDFLHKLNQETDSSLFLCEEALNFGFKVYLYHPSSTRYENKKITADAVLFGTETLVSLDLSDVDFILIRQDPPFDLNYFTNTHLLEHTRAYVINSSQGIRNVSEKLSILHFPDFIPKTLLTTKKNDVITFLDHHEKAILKPLYECGGTGVSLIHKANKDLSSYLDLFSQKYPGHFLVQEFLPLIQEEGDKRIFILDGSPILGYKRLPQKGSILANLCQDATAIAYDLTEHDMKIASIVGKWLKEEGIFFAGIDLIGDFLIEINVTSPTGLRTAQNLYGINLAKLFWKRLLRS